LRGMRDERMFAAEREHELAQVKHMTKKAIGHRQRDDTRRYQ
jgi:hypothetical protein